MMNERDFLVEEKECAEMLGMTVKEYREDLKKTKVPAKEEIQEEKIEYDNSFLTLIGADESYLKKKKYII